MRNENRRKTCTITWIVSMRTWDIISQKTKTLCEVVLIARAFVRIWHLLTQVTSGLSEWLGDSPRNQSTKINHHNQSNHWQQGSMGIPCPPLINMLRQSTASHVSFKICIHVIFACINVYVTRPSHFFNSKVINLLLHIFLNVLRNYTLQKTSEPISKW